MTDTTTMTTPEEQAALGNAVSVEVTAKDLMYEKVDLTDGVYYYNGNEITYWGLLPGGRLELDTLNVDCVQEVQLPHTFQRKIP